MTREFDSIRSRSANIVIRTFTNNYLVLVVAGYAFVPWKIEITSVPGENSARLRETNPTVTV
jgi:hypothetical protein